eukprot:3047597-Pyramimonas_sp.AAC.1
MGLQGPALSDFGFFLDRCSLSSVNLQKTRTVLTPLLPLPCGLAEFRSCEMSGPRVLAEQREGRQARRESEEECDRGRRAG